MGAGGFAQPSPILFLHISIPSWAQERSSGCVNPASWLPLASAGEDTQHWALPRAQPSKPVISEDFDRDHTVVAASRPFSEKIVSFLSALMPNLNTVFNGKGT